MTLGQAAKQRQADVASKDEFHRREAALVTMILAEQNRQSAGKLRHVPGGVELGLPEGAELVSLSTILRRVNEGGLLLSRASQQPQAPRERVICSTTRDPHSQPQMRERRGGHSVASWRRTTRAVILPAPPTSSSSYSASAAATSSASSAEKWGGVYEKIVRGGEGTRAGQSRRNGPGN